MTNGSAVGSRPVSSLGRFLLTLLAITALAAVPLVLSSFYVFVATRVLILAVFAMAYDVVFGYGGMPSLGHAAFFGLGAYALGLGVSRWEWGFVQVLVVALLAGAILGLITGILTIRTRGMHLLLLTLALAQALWGLAFQQVSLTKGDNGISGITRSTVPFSAVDTTSYYLFVAATAMLVFWLLHRYLHSVMGRVLRGARESETRMEALGFRVSVYRVAAFMVSGSLSALAGVLSVYLVGFVGPEVVNWPLSAEVMLVTILGGAGTLFGPALGSAFLIIFETLVSARSQRWMLMLGVTYIVVGMVLPGGLMGLAKRLNARWRPRQSEKAVTDIAIDSIPEIAVIDSLPSPAEVSPNRSASGMYSPALEARSLSQHFDGLAALEDVSLMVAKGERRVIIGPNGAGKSTLFNIVSGQQSPTHGRVLLFGEDVTSARPFGRARLGVGRTFQIPNLLARLTLFENAKLAVVADRGPRLGFWRDLDSHHEVVEAARELLTTWGLWSQRNQRVAELPYGLQRILEIVLALAGQPRLLLLDEPTAGLAAAEAAVVVDLINQFSRDLTIVMIEHDMDVAFAIADSVTVLVDGAILATGTPQDIRGREEVLAAYVGEEFG